MIDAAQALLRALFRLGERKVEREIVDAARAEEVGADARRDNDGFEAECATSPACVEARAGGETYAFGGDSARASADAGPRTDAAARDNDARRARRSG